MRDKKKTLPSSSGAACAGLCCYSSTFGICIKDPDLRTRNRVTGLQLHIQQNISSKRGLGARAWKEEVELSHFDLESRGSTCSAAKTSWQPDTKCCICMKNTRLTGSSDGITTQLANKSTESQEESSWIPAITFRNKPYSFHSYQELLYAMVVLSHRLIVLTY